MKRRIIVGGSHAAIAALEAIHQLDPESVTTVISAEPPYSPTALTGFLSGDLKEEHLGLRDSAFFSRMNARLVLGYRAMAVDAKERQVILEDDSRLAYDQLLIATGASPAVPAIDGLAREEALTLRTVADARRLLNLSSTAKRALVIGAGLIGMEAAACLQKQGLQVTVVETLDHVLPLYFDRDAASIIESAYRQRGIDIIKGARVTAISKGAEWLLRLGSGENLEADLVLIAAGVAPNVGLVKGSDIRIATGILVDEMMQTTVPDVFAAGDVAQGRGLCGEEGTMAPTVFNAIHQGFVAGSNMAGGAVKSPGTVNSNVFNFFGNVAFSVGRSLDENGLQVFKEMDGENLKFRKLVLNEGRVVGCSMINQDVEPGLFRRAVREGWKVGQALQQIHDDLPGAIRRTLVQIGGIELEEKRSGLAGYGGRRLKLHPEKCTGCNMCVYACSLKHSGDTKTSGSRIGLVPLGSQGQGYVPLNCLHCIEPECVKVCPNNAIRQGTDGLVSVDDDRCIGCLLCTLACPYGGSRFDAQANKSMVCDLCDGSPECVRLCPEEAIQFDGVSNIRIPLAGSRDPISKGVSLCLGCPSEIALRFATRVLGRDMILHVPPSCASLIIAGYGLTPSCELACMLGFLTNSGSIMTGVKRHYQHLGKDVKVVTYTGDGGTADVGFQSLSGAAERNEEIIYICNDNEGYMNTGIQRSGTTPYGAWTSTTPVGEVGRGKKEPRKEMPLIMLAHRVPYVATATVGFLSDFEYKLRKAMQTRGFSYIHLLNPCPTGWRFPTEKTVEVSRMAVRTNFFPLWEAENGRMRFTVKIRARRPVEEYTGLMEKYSHLDQEQLGLIQRMVDQDYQKLKSLIASDHDK